jgi:probable F420-dependent oxidoreductase
VIERDPIVLAKEVASVDHLSNGRFLFGIGGGWNREEMANHGTDPRERWEILRERIEAMKAIWADDNAEYHGKHVDFDPIWSWPKPVQRPHPPILVGGSGPTTFDRVLSYGDGWIPVNGRGAPMADQIAELQQRAASRVGAATGHGLRCTPKAAVLRASPPRCRARCSSCRPQVPTWCSAARPARCSCDQLSAAAFGGPAREEPPPRATRRMPSVSIGSCPTAAGAGPTTTVLRAG